MLSAGGAGGWTLRPGCTAPGIPPGPGGLARPAVRARCLQGLSRLTQLQQLGLRKNALPAAVDKSPAAAEGTVVLTEYGNGGRRGAPSTDDPVLPRTRSTVSLLRSITPAATASQPPHAASGAISSGTSCAGRAFCWGRP